MTSFHEWFHPFAIIAMVLTFLLLYVTIRTNCDLPTLVKSLNTLGAQPTGITVLTIGCVMLVLCKQYGLDPTIAGGIIGCGTTTLLNQFSKHPSDLPPGSVSSDTSVVQTGPVVAPLIHGVTTPSPTPATTPLAPTPSNQAKP